MGPPPDLSSYRLSSQESQHIFDTQIVPCDIDPVPTSAKHPLAILAVGQTGAGKTRIVPAVLAALAAAGRTPVHLIADVYKTYHPAYTGLPSHLASPATGPDARKWLDMAAAEAARRGQDVVIESACRHPDDFTCLAATFHSASYRLIVMILAVPYPLSRLGILVRYYQGLPEARSRGLPLRLTPAKVHDDSYGGLARVAEWLDQSSVADVVAVVRRGNLVAYLDDSGRGGVAHALATERRRPLTGDEERTARRGLAELSGVAEAAQQCDEIGDLLEGILRHNGAVAVDEFPPLRRLELGDQDCDGDEVFQVRSVEA